MTTEPERIIIPLPNGLAMSVANPKAAAKICAWCSQNVKQASGNCMCEVACDWNACPMNSVDDFVPPEVPRFKKA